MKILMMILSLCFASAAVTANAAAPARNELMGDADCTTVGQVRDRWTFEIKKKSEVGNEIHWYGEIKKVVRALNLKGQVVNVPMKMQADVIGNPGLSSGQRFDDQMRSVTITTKIQNPDLGTVETSVLEAPMATYFNWALRSDRLRTPAELMGLVTNAASMIYREQFVERARHNITIFCNFNTGLVP